MTRVVFFTMKGVKWWSSHIVIARKDRMDDAAIHRVSGRADGFVSSLTGSQWIATGYALAMTRVRKTVF